MRAEDEQVQMYRDAGQEACGRAWCNSCRDWQAFAKEALRGSSGRSLLACERPG